MLIGQADLLVYTGWAKNCPLPLLVKKLPTISQNSVVTRFSDDYYVITVVRFKVRFGKLRVIILQSLG